MPIERRNYNQRKLPRKPHISSGLAHSIPFGKRYSRFYPKGTKIQFLRSLNGEKAAGSSQESFFKHYFDATGKRITLDRVPMDRPLIELIPREDVRAVVRHYFGNVFTNADRIEILKQMPKGNDDYTKIQRGAWATVRLAGFQHAFAAADWYEKTFRKEIGITSGLLEWVEELRRIKKEGEETLNRLRPE